jgi:hypothetical protein
MNAKTLVEQIEALPDDRQREIADFVAFIRQQEERRQRNWQVTVEAMEAARRGEVKSFATIEDLVADLHADEDAEA